MRTLRIIINKFVEADTYSSKGSRVWYSDTWKHTHAQMVRRVESEVVENQQREFGTGVDLRRWDSSLYYQLYFQMM